MGEQTTSFTQLFANIRTHNPSVNDDENFDNSGDLNAKGGLNVTFQEGLAKILFTPSEVELCTRVRHDFGATFFF
jgi:hypothetical protein